jgi:hypothetical protein
MMLMLAPETTQWVAVAPGLGVTFARSSHVAALQSLPIGLL